MSFLCTFEILLKEENNFIQVYLNFKSNNYQIKTNMEAGIASSAGIATSYGVERFGVFTPVEARFSG